MNKEISVAVALVQARALGLALLDAQLMLARLLGTTRTGLIAHDEALLGADSATRWAAWLARRTAGEPLAYLLGEKEFHGLMLEVTPGVLVPRPETELLVDWAGELLRRRKARSAVIDLGTGSGAIALAVKHAHPDARVVATDTSLAALAVARRNAQRLSLEIELIESSWWDGLDERRFDLALANPPYVRADDPALATLGHEPRAALTPGADGLVAIASIVAAAPNHLEAGAYLLLEHGFDQAEGVVSLLGAAGFDDIETRHDLAGHARATGARRASTPR